MENGKSEFRSETKSNRVTGSIGKPSVPWCASVGLYDGIQALAFGCGGATKGK
jgi:hypothetical protein